MPIRTASALISSKTALILSWTQFIFSVTTLNSADFWRIQIEVFPLFLRNFWHVLSYVLFGAQIFAFLPKLLTLTKNFWCLIFPRGQLVTETEDFEVFFVVAQVKNGKRSVFFVCHFSWKTFRKSLGLTRFTAEKVQREVRSFPAAGMIASTYSSSTSFVMLVKKTSRELR